MDSGAQRIKIVDIFINHHSDIVAIHSTVRGVSFVMTRQSAKLWGVFFSFFWGGGVVRGGETLLGVSLFVCLYFLVCPRNYYCW